MIKVSLLSAWRADPGILIGAVCDGLKDAMRLSVSGCEDMTWQQVYVSAGVFILISSPLRNTRIRMAAVVPREDVAADAPVVQLFAKKARLLNLRRGAPCFRKIEEAGGAGH